MPKQKQTNQPANEIFERDHTKEIIFSIRRLLQSKELYTKELNKKYNVSASQLNALLAKIVLLKP